jgi:hypothetical protein
VTDAVTVSNCVTLVAFTFVLTVPVPEISTVSPAYGFLPAYVVVLLVYIRRYPTPEPPWIRNDPLDVDATTPTSVIALFEPVDTTTYFETFALGVAVGAGVTSASTAGVGLSEDCPPPQAAKVAENAATAAKRNTVRSKTIPK